MSISQPAFPSIDPVTRRIRPSHLPEEAVTSPRRLAINYTTDPLAEPEEGEMLMVLVPVLDEYFTDFTDDAVGSVPEGWSSVWGADPEVLSVVAEPTARGGQALRMSTANTAQRDRAVLWDLVPPTRDADIMFRWKSEFRPGAPRALVRGLRDEVTGYYAGFVYATAGDRTSIFAAEQGVYTELSQQPMEIPGDTWAITRLRVRGTTLSTKTWLDSEQEPEGWDITREDYRLPGPGHVGLRLYGAAGWRMVDWVSVGLYGKPAIIPGVV